MANCPTNLKSVKPRPGNTEVTQLAGNCRDSSTDLLASQLGMYAVTLKRLETTMNFETLMAGSLLGDGSICVSFDKRQDTTNYYFTESHGPNQVSYLQWKADLLRFFGHHVGLNVRARISQIKGRTIHSTEHRITVHGNNLFRPLRQKWYPDEKQVPGDLKLTPEIIAVWYMDDGDYSLFRGTITLNTQGFNKQSHHILQRELARFGIQAAISARKECGTKNLSLYLPRTQAWKLVSLVDKFVHPCLRYKVPEGYTLFKETRAHKKSGFTISTALPEEEAKSRIIANLQDFAVRHGVIKNGSFPVIQYLYDHKSYSHKPVQRLFGSFAAALIHAGFSGCMV